MASIKDVANIAGVSISTVSHVINNTKYVGDELKEKINRAIIELNYEVNPVARSLKSKKSMTIGVVITNINRIFFTQVIKGIQDAVAQHGYSLTLYSTDDSFCREKQVIEMLKNSWVDGIILDSVADMKELMYFKELASLGSIKKQIPIVSIERNFDAYGMNSVIVNNYRGGRMATRHLIDCGCRKIIHIAGPLNSCVVQDRLNGFREELIGGGMQCEKDRIVEGDFSPLSGYQIIKKLLSDGKDMDGVFAANDQMAIGALRAFKEHGCKVSEDIKVVGFDNTFIASIVEPSLTTINVPKYEMGLTAIEMLLEKINRVEPKTSSTVELPINLIVRQSTDLRAESNWDLYGW